MNTISKMTKRVHLFVPALVLLLCSVMSGQVAVSHAGGNWTIAGQKNTVVLDEADLAVSIQAGPVTWKMLPSSDHDMRVNAQGDTFYVRLADAQKIDISLIEQDSKPACALFWRASGTRAYARGVRC